MKRDTIEGRPVRLQLWDTGGQERFRTITKSYYERAMGVVLVYDCSEERSFVEIRSWMKQIEAHAHADIVRILVASKCDVEDKKVNSRLGEALAKEFKVRFFETSAKSGTGVREAFQYMAEEIFRRNPEFAELQRSIVIGDHDAAPRPTRKCC